jgi:nucleoside-diphosphate-sugar epimerase
MSKERLLVTGANGQIGTVLVEELQKRYGYDQVVASDIRPPSQDRAIFESVNVLDEKRMTDIIKQYEITQIYHLAAILSAKGEQNPKMAWEINMSGLFNILELAKEHQLKVFYPSSIAVFGTESPRQDTPQYRSVHPETVYGISKVAGEYWCLYFHKKFGVDVRSVRYPGIISYQSLPGGGTTDYAVEIFHSAVKGEPYECFLKEDTRLPMMYIPDAIRATIDLMEAPEEDISVRTSYNLAGVSFTPAEIAAEIKSQIPGFSVSYKPDFRQAIAETWTETIDDSLARQDWGWQPEYDLKAMAKDMIQNLSEQLVNS